jgi:ribokinase
LAGAVGRDPLAEVALSASKAAGVDLSRVAAVDAPTGCAAICVDPAGRNQIAVAAGANALARAAQVEDAALGPDVVVLLQMEVPPAETASLVARARARGARTVLNLAPAGPLPAKRCGRWTSWSRTSTRRLGSPRGSAAARTRRRCGRRSAAGRTWR